MPNRTRRLLNSGRTNHSAFNGFDLSQPSNLPFSTSSFNCHTLSCFCYFDVRFNEWFSVVQESQVICSCGVALAELWDVSRGTRFGNPFSRGLRRIGNWAFSFSVFYDSLLLCWARRGVTPTLPLLYTVFDVPRQNNYLYMMSFHKSFSGMWSSLPCHKLVPPVERMEVRDSGAPQLAVH